MDSRGIRFSDSQPEIYHFLRVIFPFFIAILNVLCYNGQNSALGDEMLKKYLLIFLVSMVPLIELRGAVPMALQMDLPVLESYLICILGNMLPVPIIYLFARKVLIWGADKQYIGKFFRYCLDKGERGGAKLSKTAGRGGLFVALMLFVGIPLPGTGAWTGTLAASFLNMGLRSTTASVCLGVIMAGIIMGIASTGVFSVLGI